MVDSTMRLEDSIVHLRSRGLDGASQGRLGTIGYVDRAARLRGAAAVAIGETVSLARTLSDPAAAGTDGAAHELAVRFADFGPVTVGYDRLAVDCHGVANTHLDALCHYGVDGEFFGGISREAASTELSVASWGASGIVTRALYLDIPELRGTDWVAADEPVTGSELDDAVGSRSVEPGDAALVYMGRDRFEDAGNAYPKILEVGDGERGGLGPTAAEWIADHKISLLCWDFLDACAPHERPRSVHLLIWAIGLALVDNCNLGGPVRDTLRDHGSSTGLLTVAPLRLEGATGSLVNPLLTI